MKSPAEIQDFLTRFSYKFDNSAQTLGDEPNSRRKPWADSHVRMLLAASWPYAASAGNQAIPMVYSTINDYRTELGFELLCDRYYLPATPRDLKMYESNGIPVFGIESKHAALDFDVFGTSISYPVLTMSFVKMLSMSSIPPKRKERQLKPEAYPFVIVGGQSYGAPEVLSPIVDAYFCGEAEDEPGNPGIGALLERIGEYKLNGAWSTNRLACYKELALEFNWLYFPRFIDVEYAYVDHSYLGGPAKTKQVSLITSNLPGMPLQITKRYVKDLDAVPSLTRPPLLYTDAMNVSSDFEVGRSCVAWSIPRDARVEIAGRGSVRFGTVRAGEQIKVGSEYQTIAGVVLHGQKPLIEVHTAQGHFVECTEEHEILVVSGGSELNRAEKDAAPRVWKHARDLQSGDMLLRSLGGVIWPETYAAIGHQCAEHYVGRAKTLRLYPESWPTELTPDLGWFLGTVTGDSYIRGNQVDVRIEDRSPLMAERLRSVAHDLFQITPTESASADGPTTIFRLNSKRLVVWLEHNFGISKKNRKIVPSAIFESPRAVVAEYLSALYDCNGTSLIPNSLDSSVTIRLDVVSESQIRDVAELLRMFGLPSAIRSSVNTTKRDGSPSAKMSTQWQVRSVGSDDPDAYLWLVSRESFKGRYLDQFRPPENSYVGKDSLQYLEVTDLRPGRTFQVMDVEVPGPQAFNVNGVYVHNCAFCALAWRSKPAREKSLPSVVTQAQEFHLNTGGTNITPFSPDFPFYSQKNALTRALVENVSDEIDSGAMRVDDFLDDKKFISMQVNAGMNTITLGIEGSSQRMRDLVGKGITDEEIKEAVARGIVAGVRKFKFFMISNLPGEDDNDMRKILYLGKEIADIRDGLGHPRVKIQFSWTPLLIEANTPLQWFAVPNQYKGYQGLFDEFRDLGITFKIGAKAQPDKIAFFQTCQRASREVGEALVDVICDYNIACWGGVPKGMEADIESRLHTYGFKNGYQDVFGERSQENMFGWEFIDQGFTTDIMWRTFARMREFTTLTDSESYDDLVMDSGRGAEWLRRCDDACMTKSCGVCDKTDLQKRQEYLIAGKNDHAVEITDIKPIEQRSVVVKVRAKLFKSETHRMVGNDHWRYAFRRAAFRASDHLKTDFQIAKKTIRFVSDTVNYRDWTCGTDYVEFGLTKLASKTQIREFMAQVTRELEQASPGLALKEHIILPASTTAMRTDVDLSLWELELNSSLSQARQALDIFAQADYVKMLLKVEGGYYSNIPPEEVNAKDYVHDVWLRREGPSLILCLLSRGKPSPYVLFGVIMGKSSWIEAASKPAIRVDAFLDHDWDQADFLRPSCVECEAAIPVNVLDQPYDTERCPVCRSGYNGTLLYSPRGVLHG